VVEMVEKKNGYGGGDEWPREEEKRKKRKKIFCDFWIFVK
jgi:hypothetical protein